MCRTRTCASRWWETRSTWRTRRGRSLRPTRAATRVRGRLECRRGACSLQRSHAAGSQPCSAGRPAGWHPTHPNHTHMPAPPHAHTHSLAHAAPAQPRAGCFTLRRRPRQTLTWPSSSTRSPTSERQVGQAACWLPPSPRYSPPPTRRQQSSAVLAWLAPPLLRCGVTRLPAPATCLPPCRLPKAAAPQQPAGGIQLTEQPAPAPRKPACC